MLTADQQIELQELEAKALRIELREIYKNNLFALCKLIGFNDLGEFHKDLCRKLEQTEGKPRRLFLLPRGHFKTSVISTANIVRQIIRNPNIRILLASSTLENVKKVLAVIKGVFWTNPEFRAVFPEFCPPEKVREFGTQLGFTVPNRTDKTVKEDTVECAGVGQNIIGRHYDMIVLSDIVTPETVTTAQQIEKTDTWVKMSLSYLNNPSINRVDMEGTRYHYDDVHGKWEKEAKKNPTRYFLYKRPVIERIKGKEVALFPELFLKDGVDPLEGIESIKRDQGSFVFSGQYLLDPIDEDTVAFKRSQIQYIPRAQIPRTENMAFKYPLYMAIDPAISQDVKADHAVITVSMIDTNNNMYIVDMAYGHWSVNEFVNNVLRLNHIYNPVSIGIETVSFQKLLLHIIDEVTRKENIILPIHQITRDTSKTKRMRIMQLQPRFEQGKIYFAENLDKGFIEEQILRFNPSSYNNKDDLLDTIADLQELLVVPDVQFTERYQQFPARRYIDWLESDKNGDEDDTFQFDPEEGESEYYSAGSVSANSR